ncbi:MAG: tyrosine--tRNA ligase [bacterium]
MADLNILHKTGIQEILSEQDLIYILENVKNPNHYIGFEISGKLHIGQGIGTMKVIKKLQELGVHCTIFLADMHTLINDKLGGDKLFIRKTAKEYFIPAFNACAKIVGADPDKITYILGSELYASSPEYIETLMEVSKNTTLARMTRSVTIMGRKEGDSIDFSKLLYPPMQVADIFTMNIHIAHAGMDQRKAHVIAIDTADKIKNRSIKDDKGNKIKPVAIHHKLVKGLAAPSIWPLTDEQKNDSSVMESLKMSKSKPGSAIFVTDSEEVIKSTMKKAFCPPLDVEYNPIIDWIDAFVFDLIKDGEKWLVKRDEKWGGNVEYTNIDQVKKDYMDDKISGQDLKNNLADWLVELLAPARKLTEDQNIRDIISGIEKYQVKR